MEAGRSVDRRGHETGQGSSVSPADGDSAAAGASLGKERNREVLIEGKAKAPISTRSGIKPQARQRKNIKHRLTS
jgi:hypothetical protein